MTTDQEHRELEDLLGAYALDAVDGDEARAVDRHLEECPRCRAEVDAHRMVAGAIGNSVEPMPAHLWDRIARELDTAGRPQLVVPPAPRVGASEDAPAGAPGGPGAVVTPLRRQSRRQGGRSRVLAAATGALAVAAVAVAAVLAVNLSGANSHVRQLNAAVAAKGASSAVTTALQTPGHQTVPLATPAGTELASLVVLPDGRGYMVTSHMAALPSGETYQLWARVAGRSISAGLLGRQPQVGSGFTVASGSPTALAITVEPSGGVRAPTSAPVVQGPVTTA